MNEYQEELVRSKLQELLVHIGMLNNDAQWPMLDLYAGMCTYLEVGHVDQDELDRTYAPGTAL